MDAATQWSRPWPICISPLGPKRKKGCRQHEKGDFGERRLQMDKKLSTAHQKWLRTRFKMGGAYSNFAFRNSHTSVDF